MHGGGARPARREVTAGSGELAGEAGPVCSPGYNEHNTSGRPSFPGRGRAAPWPREQESGRPRERGLALSAGTQKRQVGWQSAAEPPADVGRSRAGPSSALRVPGTRHAAGQRACEPARRHLEGIPVQRQRTQTGFWKADHLGAQLGVLPAEDQSGAGGLLPSAVGGLWAPGAPHGPSCSPPLPAALAG